MKQVINGHLYNTMTMTTLASRGAYNNGNYCGESKICLTKSGVYAFVRTSNGQDLRREGSIEAIGKNQVAELIDGWTLDDNEVAALVEHGLIVEA